MLIPFFNMISPSYESKDFSPDRELALRIRHSPLPNAIKKRSFSMRREEKLAIVKEHHLEGEFQLYVEGKEKFEVPLYVVSLISPSPRLSRLCSRPMVITKIKK